MLQPSFFSTKPLSVIRVAVWIFSVVAFSGALFAQDSGLKRTDIALSKIRIGDTTGVVGDRWTVVYVRLFNRTDKKAVAVVTTASELNPESQFGRRVSIPANSFLETLFPIFVEQIPGNKKQLDFRTLLFHERNGKLETVPILTGEMFRDDTRMVNHSSPTIALLNGDPDPASATSAIQEQPNISDAVTVLRHVASRDHRITILNRRGYPRTTEQLAQFDAIAIADSDIKTQPAVAAAVGQWIRSGGTCWIMLDQAGVETAEAILGSDFDVSVVERERLSSFVMTNSEPYLFGQPELERTFETPIDFLKVAVSGARVQNAIGQWPAAFWINAGKGQVMVTTLAPEAWIYKPQSHSRWRRINRRATKKNRKKRGKSTTQNSVAKSPTYKATIPFRNICTQFLKPSTSNTTEQIKKNHQQKIGFRVTQKPVIASCLLLLASFVGVGGCIAIYKKKLALFSAMVPIVALLIGGVIAMLGVYSRTSAEATSAETQIVHLDMQGKQFNTTGIRTDLNTDTINADITGQLNGTFSLETENNIQRMLWSDTGDWKISGRRIPVGLYHSHFNSAHQLSEPILINAIVSQKGIEGHLQFPGEPKTVEDAVLIFGNRFIPISVDSAGRFKIKSSESNPGKQFLKTTLISNEQRRRDALYRELFQKSLETISANLDIHRFDEDTKIAFWMSPPDSGIKANKTISQNRTGLYFAKVNWKPCEADKHIKIPDLLLKYESVLKPAKKMADQKKKMAVRSLVYDGRSCRWNPLCSPTELTLRVQIPETLQPIAVDKLRITVDINAPRRTLTCCGYKDGREITLDSSSAMDQVSFTIDDPDMLQQDDRGGVYFGLKVSQLKSKPKDYVDAVTWSINDVYIELHGKTYSD